jgi:hypothetical protein
MICKKGGNLLKITKRKNIPKAHNHISLKVGQPVKEGFDEALKDSSKKILCFCFEKFVFFIINFLLIYLSRNNKFLLEINNKI